VRGGQPACDLNTIRDCYSVYKAQVYQTCIVSAFITKIANWITPLRVKFIGTINPGELREEKCLRVRGAVRRWIQGAYAAATKAEGPEILSGGRNSSAPLNRPS
jgi:hypothetical protein